jgi:SRSO17 transposase
MELNTDEIKEMKVEQLKWYKSYLGRTEYHSQFYTIFDGRISFLGRKNIMSICSDFEDTDEFRNFYHFMVKVKWDDNGMLHEHGKELAEITFHQDGMIAGDGCDFPKSGCNSVGVFRQYCGSRKLSGRRICWIRQYLWQKSSVR